MISGTELKIMHSFIYKYIYKAIACSNTDFYEMQIYILRFRLILIMIII